MLLECIYNNGERQSPTKAYREFNNVVRLTGREQVMHKTLLEPVAELELYSFIEVERKGCRRGRGVDFYISSIRSVARKVLLDALKDVVA